jgi:hypothetical protein
LISQACRLWKLLGILLVSTVACHHERQQCQQSCCYCCWQCLACASPLLSPSLSLNADGWDSGGAGAGVEVVVGVGVLSPQQWCWLKVGSVSAVGAAAGGRLGAVAHEMSPAGFPSHTSHVMARSYPQISPADT